MDISPEQLSCLQSLKIEFEKFRATGSRGKKIPEELRDGIFSAIESGINPSRLQKMLGVTSSQLLSWSQQGSESKSDPAAPRVLEVVAGAQAPAIPNGLRVTYEVGRLILEFSF